MAAQTVHAPGPMLLDICPDATLMYLQGSMDFDY